MSHALESLGYVVMVLGPLLGIGFIVFGNTIFLITGVLIIFASFLISLYHLSFSLLMNGMRDLTRMLKDNKLENVNNKTSE